MPMLDPLATFLLKVKEAGGDVEPVAALFRTPADVSTAQRDMAEQLAGRARDGGLIADTGADPVRVALTAEGERYLTGFDL